MNCWINQSGHVREIVKTLHAVERQPTDCIRVSMPERRRTWVGIEVVPGASHNARLALLRLIRQLRREARDIVATVDNKEIECYAFQRPTRLNAAILKGSPDARHTRQTANV